MKKLLTIIASMLTIDAVGQVNVGLEVGSRISAGINLTYKLKPIANISSIIGIGGGLGLTRDRVGNLYMQQHYSIAEVKSARSEATHQSYFSGYGIIGARINQFEIILKGGVKDNFYYQNVKSTMPYHRGYFREWVVMVGGSVGYYFDERIGLTAGYDDLHELNIGVKYQF